MKSKRLLHGRMLPALALAGAASFVELGPIAVLLREDTAIVPILLAGFAYQLGNTIPGSSNRAIFPTLIAAAALSAAALVYAGTATAPWFAAIAVLSWSLQTVRRRLTAKPGEDLPTTAAKRVARVFGFLLATLVLPAFWAPLVALAIVAALYVAKDGHARHSPTAANRRGDPGIEVAMVLHQAHYFSYCYAIPLLLASSVTGGVTAAGLWFACGWVSYLSAESLWQRFGPTKVFVLGHLFLAMILALITQLSHAPWPVLLLWVFSGLGGGTVYCLTLLHRRNGGDPVRLEHAEDTGHILGIAVVLAGAMILKWGADTLPLVGAAWAATAAITVLIVAWRSRHASLKSRRQETFPCG